MTTVRFWRLTAERAAKSFAQGVLATWLGVGQVMDVEQAAELWSWTPWVGGAATAVFSVLTSIATAGVGPADDPSLV